MNLNFDRLWHRLPRIVIETFFVLVFIVATWNALIYISDCRAYIRDIDQANLQYFFGNVENVYIPSVAPGSVSGADIVITLDDANMLSFYPNSVFGYEFRQLRESIENKPMEYYYTNHIANTSFWGDNYYHVLVSVSDAGFNANIAESVRREWLGRELAGIGGAALSLLLTAISVFWFYFDLSYCIISKAEQERLAKKGKRKAERRAKYLEERQRQRETKGKR